MQFIIRTGIIVLRIPLRVHSPSLVQGHTTSCGVSSETALPESVARKLKAGTSDRFVITSRFQLKVYSPSPLSSKLAPSGIPPTTSTVKVSPSSTTVKLYTALCPTVTLNTLCPVIFGGKLPIMEQEKWYLNLLIATNSKMHHEEWAQEHSNVDACASSSPSTVRSH